MTSWNSQLLPSGSVNEVNELSAVPAVPQGRVHPIARMAAWLYGEYQLADVLASE